MAQPGVKGLLARLIESEQPIAKGWELAFRLANAVALVVQFKPISRKSWQPSFFILDSEALCQLSLQFWIIFYLWVGSDIILFVNECRRFTQQGCHAGRVEVFFWLVGAFHHIFAIQGALLHETELNQVTKLAKRALEMQLRQSIELSFVAWQSCIHDVGSVDPVASYLRLANISQRKLGEYWIKDLSFILWVARIIEHVHWYIKDSDEKEEPWEGFSGHQEQGRTNANLLGHCSGVLLATSATR